MRYFLIIIGLILSIGCSFEKDNLAGNWYSCARNGDYIEMFVENNKFRYATNFGIITSWQTFKISGDTLIQFDDYTFKDSLLIKKAIINYEGQNQFTMNYLTSIETWTMHRIDERIDLNKTDAEILKGTLKRAGEIACPDTRTEEEKDSLNYKINFQF